MRSFNVPFQKVSETSTTLTVDADLDVNGDVSPDGIYLGGSTSANYLDDYEEGTWTPIVQDDASSGNTATATVSGAYTKVGDLVTIHATILNIDTTGMTSTNDVFIKGIPFSNSSNIAIGPAISNRFLFVSSSSYFAYYASSVSFIKFASIYNGNDNADYARVSDILNNSSDIFFSITYKT